MTLIDPKHLEAAFVPADTPSFAQLIDRLPHTHLSATRRRDLASGLRRVAKALGKPCDGVFADPGWLRPRLDKIVPVAIGVSDKSWSNALSDTRAAMKLFGVVQPRPNRAADLGDAWRPLWEALLADDGPTLAPALGRFVRFLDRCGVAPEAVAQSHAEAFREAVALNEIRRSPETAMTAAIYGWNKAVERIDGWPRQRLSVTPRGNRYALDLDRFPVTFRDEVATWLSSLERPDLLDDTAPTAPLRPATIRHRRAQVLRFASALVHDGVPIAEVGSLSMLVHPDLAERGLRWMLARNGGRSSPGIADTAVMLKVVARTHVRPPAEDLERIDRLAVRLAVPVQKGMTFKNRERLRAVQDAEALRRLLRVPSRLFERADGLSGRKAALDREVALAIALLLQCPVRRRNLVETRFDTTLVRPGDGRVFLLFEEEEVKNRRRIEFELRPKVVAMLDRHLENRSPALCPSTTPWLFPGRDGAAPMDASFLSRKVGAAIRKEAGLEFNPHLFRHLTAMIWLGRNPGSYEAVRRILGHAELSSTLDAYAGFEAGSAATRFAELLEEILG